MLLKILCILGLTVMVVAEHAYSSQHVHWHDGHHQLVYIHKHAEEHKYEEHHHEPPKHDEELKHHEQPKHHLEHKEPTHFSQYIHQHDGHAQPTYIQHDSIHKKQEHHHEEVKHHHEEEKHSHEEKKHHEKPKKHHEKKEPTTSSQYIHKHDGHAQPAYIVKTESHHHAEEHHHEEKHHHEETKHHSKETKLHEKPTKNHEKKEPAYSSHYIHRHDGHAQPVYRHKHEHHHKPENHEQSKHEKPKHEKKEHDVNYYADSKYKFEYKVDDPNTGDHKQQHEHYDGHDTESDYALKIKHIVPEHHHKKHEYW